MEEKEWKQAVQMYIENRSLKEIQEKFDLSKDRIPELKTRALEERTEGIEERLTQ
jgi:hypothetical protein